MGALTSRQHAGVEEVDIPSNSVYRYPPKSGEGRARALRAGRRGGRASDAAGRLRDGPRRPRVALGEGGGLRDTGLGVSRIPEPPTLRRGTAGACGGH